MSLTKKEIRKIKLVFSLSLIWTIFWVWRNSPNLYELPSIFYYFNIILIGLLLTLWNLKDWKDKK